MKMNQAEVEFVAFDAQDVITASGDYIASGAFTINDWTDLGMDSVRGREAWFHPIDFSEEVKSYYIINSPVIYNSEYDYVDGVKVYYDQYAVLVTGTDTQPTGSPINMGNVLDWLHNNTDYDQ